MKPRQTRSPWSTIRLSVLALCLVSIAPIARAQGGANWEVVGQPGFSAADVWCAQIGVSPAGIVHVAYQDHSLGSNRASVQRFINGAWTYVGAKGEASVGTAWYNHLAFDAAGSIYVASRDYGTNGKTNVRKGTPGAPQVWTNVGQQGMSSGDAHYTHVATHSDGTIYVVYADADQDNAATVRRFRNGFRQTLGAAGFTGHGAGYTSLAISRTGAVFVAFADGGHLDASGEGKVSVMRYDDAADTWRLVGAPGFTPNGGLNARLAFDGDDVPYVAYQKYHERIVVMKLVDGTWKQVGGSASGADRPVIETESWRQWCSIAFDSQNTPYVAYQLLDQGRKAAVRKLVGSSWVPVGSIGFSAGAADYFAMTVDALDVPYIVFRDGALNGRATVMRFAPSPYVYCAGVVSSIGCNPQISVSGTASASNPQPFFINGSAIISQRAGLLLYSYAPGHLPLGNGFLCLSSPWMRFGLQNSGGSAAGNDCSGTLSADFNAVIQTGVVPGLVAGKTVCAQYWYRDAQNPLGPGLTNAVRFLIGP